MALSLFTDLHVSSLSLFVGFGLPRVAEAEVRQRVQDTPAGPPSDPGDGRRERAQGADGRAHAGDGGLASEHCHAAGTQLAGQQHRRHPPQEKEGQDTHKYMKEETKRTHQTFLSRELKHVSILFAGNPT